MNKVVNSLADIDKLGLKERIIGGEEKPQERSASSLLEQISCQLAAVVHRLDDLIKITERREAPPPRSKRKKGAEEKTVSQ